MRRFLLIFGWFDVIGGCVNLAAVELGVSPGPANLFPIAIGAFAVWLANDLR